MSLPAVNIAIYGANGHQIHDLLVNRPNARLVGIAEFPREKLLPALRADPEVRDFSNLAELLADPRVELVSLCSPRRRDQAADAIRALAAGKHVYAEKPCAFDEAELDEILRVAQQTGKMFREMAGTAFLQPYYAMREIVRAGRIGRVVQVIAEKSYPFHVGRPQDEDIDGGLIRQCAIHGVRFVEHVAGARVRSIRAMESTASNPVAGGGLRMAACLMMELEGGGLASVVANYLNPPGTGIWGYETLRILGDEGLVESTQSGGRTRLVIGGRDFGRLDLSAPGIEYLTAYLNAIRGVGDMPVTLEEELSPTRWVIRAKQTLCTGENSFGNSTPR
jgi:predicted dehydrogenase